MIARPDTALLPPIRPYVDNDPVPQTGLASSPFCFIPSSPCAAIASGGTLFGLASVGSGMHTVAVRRKTTSGTLVPPATPGTAEVGGIAVG